MTLYTFNIFLIVMTAVAVVVFVSLFFVDAGYGKFYDKKWGPAVNNKLGFCFCLNCIISNVRLCFRSACVARA